MKSFCIIALAFIMAAAPVSAHSQSPTSWRPQPGGGRAQLEAVVELLGQMLQSGEDELRQVSANSSEMASYAAMEQEGMARYLKGLRRAEASESAPPQAGAMLLEDQAEASQSATQMRAMLQSDIDAAEESVAQLQRERGLAQERQAQMETLTDGIQSGIAALWRMREGLESNVTAIDADRSSSEFSSDFCELTRVVWQLRQSQLLLTQTVLAASESKWLLKEGSEKHFVTALGYIIQNPQTPPQELKNSQISRAIHLRKDNMLKAELKAAREQEATLELQVKQLGQNDAQEMPCPAVTPRELSSEVVVLAPVLEEMAVGWEHMRLRVVQEEIRQIDASIQYLTSSQENFAWKMKMWEQSPVAGGPGDPMPTDPLDPPADVRIEELQQQRAALVKTEEQLSAAKRATQQ